jgi:hypothetical protein
MHDHFDAFAFHAGTSRPLFSRQESWRHDNELLSRVLTDWYLVAPQTREEWDALRGCKRPRSPGGRARGSRRTAAGSVTSSGRSRAERLERIRELSRRITAMIRDQIPNMDPQPLRDFANPPPGLSESQRGHLLQDVHDLVCEAKDVTILRSLRADRLGPATDRALDRPGDPAEGTVPPALTTEAKAPGTAGAPIPEPLAETVRLLGRGPWRIKLVEFLAGRMGQRIPLREITQVLCRVKEPTRERVRNMRKLCERTRNTLNDKACPLRLSIQENSVWLEEYP